jgi:hypothetical protein
MHDQLYEVCDVVTRKAKELASFLIYLSCRSSVVAVEWTEYNKV